MREDPIQSPLSRRTFVASACATATAAALVPLVPRRGDAAPRGSSSRRTSTRRRHDVVEVEERSVAEWQAALARGELTSRDLVERYLQRIESLDRTGPMLHAVLETNPDALDIAASLDAERRAGKTRGPMHGIPVLVKDNIDTADRMHTTAGSEALVDGSPTRDAFVVERLRAAGAIVLGKTNLTEWANFRSTHASSGWSARGGQARNPYALDRTPVGLQLGLGDRRGVELLHRRRRHGDRRLHHLARGGVLARRPQADRRPREPQRHRTDLAHAGHGRPDVPLRRRCGGAARRARRRAIRATPPRRTRAPPTTSPRSTRTG